MAEVILVDEVIFRLFQDGLGDDLVKDVVVLIGEEHGLDVGVLDTDMDHTIVLLILAGELMLLDLAGSVVVGVGAEHKTILGTALHGLGIHVIALLGVTLEPALGLPLLEIGDSLVVHERIVILKHRIEIYLGLGDMEKGLLASHLLRLGGIEHVVRRSRDLCDYIFGRTNRREGFYSYHRFFTSFRMTLFVNLETGVTCGEEVANLAGGGETGVHVGLSCLGTHLLGSREDPQPELLLESLVVVRHHVGDILKVRTLLESLHKSLLVNNFLSGGVDQASAFRHLGDKVVTDALDSRRQGGNMD